ncbi:MAG: sulfatase [Proteobacteria bacterium]|nr:sulfatase [Pseudomonadota bacterium]
MRRKISLFAVSTILSIGLMFLGNRQLLAEKKRIDRPELRRRPNIVFILSDDHRWDYLSSLDHPFIETPNLDRLADEGVHFTNAFCTTSLCSPSRASFLTGQNADTHGVQNNMTPWNNENVHFLEPLKEDGYRTAFIGKWHMPGKLPELRGIDRFVTFEVVGGQGVYFDCPLIVDGKHTPSRKRYITEELTDYTLEFIDDNKDEPFAIYLSHKTVHAPFTPPPEFKGRYDEAEVVLPEEADSWVGMTRGNLMALQFAPLESTMKNYAEAVAAMDLQIGRILVRLDRLGLTENTIVVYSSDNGYFWGEHQLVDKRWAYEESIRIPFIVRYPAMVDNPGRKAEQMVLNIDLAPSLLNLAGIDIPSGMEGSSFKPVLASASAPGRKAWHYKYFKDFFYNVPKIDAVRTETHVYIEYGNRKEAEIYSLVEDPKQKRNLIGTPEGKRLLPDLKKKLEELRSGRRN